MTPTQIVQTERVKQRLTEIAINSPRFLRVLNLAYGGNSKAAAIKAKCLDCCCWQPNEVRQCTSVTCPLWRYRPFQRRMPA